MIEISKICISNPKKTNSFVKCYHFFPSTLKKRIFGELLFLIEVKIPKNLIEKGINFSEEISEIIINGMRTNYYAKETLEDGEDVEQIFENSLQKLNRLIYQEIIGSRLFDLMIKNLNAVIVLIKDDRIYFSPTGSVKVFILKKNKIIDLVSEKTQSISSRIFSQIISGSLEKKDSLFFSTINFLDYFIFEKLSEIVSKNSVEESVKKLEDILGNLKDRVSLGSFIIRKEEIKKEEKEEMKKEKVLENKILEARKKPIKIKITPEEEKIEEIIVKEKISAPEPTKEIQIKKEGPVIKIEEESVIEEEMVIKEKPAIKEELSIKEEPVIEKKPTKKIKIPKISLKLNLPKIKILPLFFIITAIFLMVFFIKFEKTKEGEILKFFVSLQEIQEKSAFLKVSSKYEGKERAWKLVQEIEEKIDLLKPKNNLERKIVENFRSNFQNTIDEIYRVKRINQPITIINYVNEKIDPQNIIKLENQIYTLDKKTGEIYRLDFKNGKNEKLAKSTLLGRLENFDFKNLLIYDNQKIFIFNLENKKISPLKLVSSEKNFFIDDLKIYDKKLYIFNSKTNQILKYLPEESGFDKENLWLKEKVDLKNINSFAIDGSIYLLKNSGELLKFFLGRKQPFSLENVYPVLTKPTKVYTNEEMKNIYILEPISKRILVFEKNGKLMKQIASDKFTDLKDFIVDEKTNKLYLLNDTRIFIVDLNK